MKARPPDLFCSTTSFEFQPVHYCSDFVRLGLKSAGLRSAFFCSLVPTEASIAMDPNLLMVVIQRLMFLQVPKEPYSNCSSVFQEEVSKISICKLMFLL